MFEMPVEHFEELRNMLLEFFLLSGYVDVILFKQTTLFKLYNMYFCLLLKL